MTPSFERSDWALLALQASPDHALTRVQLQKALFLFGKGLRAARTGNYYRFRPYHYGPFDPDVYADLAAMQRRGFVEHSSPSTAGSSAYQITDAGLEHISALSRVFPDSTLGYVNEVVRWLKPLTFSELVSAIYAQYPEFKKNSIFRSEQ